MFHYFLIFIILYVLTGIVRITYDFHHKSIMSADYVRNPKLSMTISSIFFWPLPIIFLFNHQAKRMNLKFFLTFYFLPSFYWFCFYLIILKVWFLMIYFSESTFSSDIIISSIILLTFSDFNWWLCSRRDKKINKIKNQCILDSQQLK